MPKLPFRPITAHRARNQTATPPTTKDSLRIIPTPLEERHHFIPEGALNSSEAAKHPQEAVKQPKADVFSEERVSKDHPSKSAIRDSAPDDTMYPG